MTPQELDNYSKKKLKNLVGLIFLFSYLSFLFSNTNSIGSQLFKVIRVMDGDTVEVEQIGMIRLIGVDTPELAHPIKPVQFFAKKASEYTKRVALGKRVRLEYDQEKIDKYGRTLAYIYFEDGRMLNAEIIKNGYGFAYTKYPFKYMKEFRKYEIEAREKGLGLWGNEGMDEYHWLLVQEKEPFMIYEMGNNWWVIKYKSYVKLRLSSEELKKELDSLRVWVHEFSEKDLRECLLKNGWKEEKNK